MLPGLKTCQQTRLEDKKKVEMMNVSMSAVLSHFLVSLMLLSVLKINLGHFLLEEALNDSVMRHYMLSNFRY